MPPRIEDDVPEHEILPENDAVEVIPRRILVSEQPWFRRPNMINRRINPNTYYRVEILEDIRGVLVQQVNLIDQYQQGPSGHFLTWNPGQNSRKLLHSIISRAIFTEQGISFHIRGRDVEYTIQDHALITGLKFGPARFDPRIARDPRHSHLFQLVCGQHIEWANWVVDQFKRRHMPFNDPTGQVRVKLANLLMANCFILGHDARTPVHPWLWHLIDDEYAFNTFPWGAYSYKTLLYYLRTFHRTGDKYHFYGPAWALMIWVFEKVNGIGDNFAQKESEVDVPRCLRWKFLNTFPGVPDSQLYAHFDLADEAISEIVPDQTELATDYFVSVYLADPMVLKFHVPTSPYISGGGRARPEVEADGEDENVARPRRSTRSNRFAGSVAEEGTSSSRRTHQQRDLGQGSSGTSAETRHQLDVGQGSSGTSVGQETYPGGVSGEEWMRMVAEHTRRESEQALKTYNENLKKKDSKKVLLTVKKWIVKGVDIVTCGTSTMSTSVPHSLPSSPPQIVQSARDSGAEYTEVETSTEGYEHLESEGARADTSLPIYTPSYSGPHIGQDPATIVSSALDSVFGTDTACSSSGPSSSFMPGFGAYYQPGPSFDSPQPPATPTGRNITIRDQPRRASSVELGQGSRSTRATDNYVPPTGPTWPDVRASYDAFRAAGDNARPIQVREQLELMYPEKFKIIREPDVGWGYEIMNLALMTLHQMLKNGRGVKPAFRNGGAIVKFKADYRRLRAECDKMFPNLREREAPTYTTHVLTYAHTNWKSSSELKDLLRGGIGQPIDMPAWWSASTVIVPWDVKYGDEMRTIAIAVNLRRQKIMVLDPLYRSFEDEFLRSEVKKSVWPFYVLFPAMLAYGGYWHCNNLGLSSSGPSFPMLFPERSDLIYSNRTNSDGPVAIMNMERYLPGWPRTGCVDDMLDTYRDLVACRIYANRC